MYPSRSNPARVHLSVGLSALEGTILKKSYFINNNRSDVPAQQRPAVRINST